jgi:hypothetical protein
LVDGPWFFTADNVTRAEWGKVVGGKARSRFDAALASHQTVWREHDANLARAWLLRADQEDQVIVLPEFGADDERAAAVLRIIALD